MAEGSMIALWWLALALVADFVLLVWLRAPTWLLVIAAVALVLVVVLFYVFTVRELLRRSRRAPQGELRAASRALRVVERAAREDGEPVPPRCRELLGQVRAAQRRQRATR